MTATLHTDDPVLHGFADEVGDSGPVAVRGAATRWELGGSPAPGTREISAPAGIVEYKPEEMTVTVRAGTAVADLHAELAAKGQRTALPERGGTVGGALAVGESDFRALGRGLVRTALLQIRYISAEGRIVSSGGPTVKNVSGFDLPRLMVGSLGTLGVLAEAIIRTNPVPAAERWLACPDADPAAVASALLAPSAVLWDGRAVTVHLEGHPADVDAQTSSLRRVCQAEEVPAPPELPQHRWSLPPSEALRLGSLDGADVGADFVATIGLGLVFSDRPQPPRTLDPNVQIVHDRLKANFDPTGRLNPGRSIGRN